VAARLAVRDLSKHYGGVQALRGVTLRVDAGEAESIACDCPRRRPLVAARGRWLAGA